MWDCIIKTHTHIFLFCCLQLFFFLAVLYQCRNSLWGKCSSSWSVRIPKRTEKWSQHGNTKNQTFLTATRGWLPKDSRIKISEFTGFGCMFTAWFWPLRESIQPNSEIKTASHSFMCKAISSFTCLSQCLSIFAKQNVLHTPKTWVYLIGITAHLNLIPGKFESHLAAALVGALAHIHIGHKWNKAK